MKLVYWLAKCHHDNRCYSIRAKTKKACVAERDQRLAEAEAGNYQVDYGEPEKVEVEYADAFDLVLACLQEGGIE